MTTFEIIVVILIASILLFVLITYLFHGMKIEKNKKKEKKKEPAKEVKTEEIKQPEQKPVPVGIIKEAKSKINENGTTEYDLAPLKDKPTLTPTSSCETKTLSKDIKDLSPEMKKVMMSDLLKPKF